MNKRLAKISKFLSLVLRHKPETIGIQLDDQSWVGIEDLLDACERANRQMSVAELHMVVESNDKKRFVVRNDRIRANQGHSLKVDLNLDSSVPPDDLFHGTATRFLDRIMVSAR